MKEMNEEFLPRFNAITELFKEAHLEPFRPYCYHWGKTKRNPAHSKNVSSTIKTGSNLKSNCRHTRNLNNMKMCKKWNSVLQIGQNSFPSHLTEHSFSQNLSWP